MLKTKKLLVSLYGWYFSSLRFFRKDKLGHIIIEVFVELDDGGDYAEHNCCFFVSTEYGLLMNFCESLVQLKKNPVEYEIQLNCS